MLRAISQSLVDVTRSIGGIASAFSTVIGAAQQMGYDTGLPSWAWWLLAIAILFISAVRLQWKLNEEGPEGDQVRRLFRKKRVLFQEIAAAISSTNKAYSRDDVIHQLMKAVWRGDFEEWSGHTRLRLAVNEFTGHSEDGEILFHRWQLAAAAPNTDGMFPRGWTKLSPRSLVQIIDFRSLEKCKPTDFGDTFIRMHIDGLMLERKDLLRWYRRFKSGRYES